MKILWARVITALIALFVLLILIVYRGPIAAFLGSMGEIGPGHTTEEKTVGLIAFGLVLVGILAVVKIVSQRASKE